MTEIGEFDPVMTPEQEGTMREVTRDEWVAFIDAIVNNRPPGARGGQFTDDGDDAMNYVVDGKVIARSTGYTLDKTGRETVGKHYYIDG